MPVELADRDTVVPIVTMLDDDATVSALVDAVIGRRRSAAPVAATTYRLRLVGQGMGSPVAALSPREAFFAPHETVERDGPVGRVSAELVAPYPPGCRCSCRARSSARRR